MANFTRMLSTVLLLIHYYHLIYHRLKGHGVGEPTFSAELQPSSSRGTAADVKMNYKLSCGPKYEVTGICTGRKDGQQLAAQKMLQV